MTAARPTVAARVCWVALFAANGVVPAIFGYHLTEPGGRAGMAAGVAALFAVWVVVVPRAPRVRAELVPGGIVLALSQVFPVLQGIAGVLSLLVVGHWDWLNPQPGPGDTRLFRVNDVTAFAATLLTGAILGLFAVVAGFVILSGWRVLTSGAEHRLGTHSRG